ncbi:hypothetical protein Tco_1134130 [Tanacetum coccineum]
MHQTQSPPLALNLSSPMKTTCLSLKGNCLEDFIKTSFKKYENNYTALRNFQQILNLFKSNHNTSMRKILENLREVHNAVKEDPALNKKVLEATEAYIKNSTTYTELLTLMKSFDFSGLKSLTASLKVVVDA